MAHYRRISKRAAERRDEGRFLAEAQERHESLAYEAKWGGLYFHRRYAEGSECRPLEPIPETDGPNYEGEPIEHSVYRGEDIFYPTMDILNATDEPRAFGGECLGGDGHGNQLWLFRSIDKLANRWGDEADDGIYEWTDDIAGWNYDVDEYGLE